MAVILNNRLGTIAFTKTRVILDTSNYPFPASFYVYFQIPELTKTYI